MSLVLGCNNPSPSPNSRCHVLPRWIASNQAPRSSWAALGQDIQQRSRLHEVLFPFATFLAAAPGDDQLVQSETLWCGDRDQYSGSMQQYRRLGLADPGNPKSVTVGRRFRGQADFELFPSLCRGSASGNRPAGPKRPCRKRPAQDRCGAAGEMTGQPAGESPASAEWYRPSPRRCWRIAPHRYRWSAPESPADGRRASPHTPDRRPSRPAHRAIGRPRHWPGWRPDRRCLSSRRREVATAHQHGDQASLIALPGARRFVRGDPLQQVRVFGSKIFGRGHARWRPENTSIGGRARALR